MCVPGQVDVVAGHEKLPWVSTLQLEELAIALQGRREEGGGAEMRKGDLKWVIQVCKTVTVAVVDEANVIACSLLSHMMSSFSLG